MAQAAPQASVRIAVPSDFDAIQAIARESLPDHVAEEEERAAFTSNILNWRRSKTAVRIATLDGEPVGYIALGPYKGLAGAKLHSHSMTLQQVAVLKEHQGAGIGSLLLESGFKAAKGLDAGLIFAAVSSANRGFYERHGWTVGEPGHGLGFVEQEQVEEAGERAPGDVVGLFSKAAPVRGGAMNRPGGYNRAAYKVVDESLIRATFFYAPADSNPEMEPRAGLLNKVIKEPSFLLGLPITTVFMITGELIKTLGQNKARALLAEWLQANPSEAAELPRRMQAPSMTPDRILDELFGV